MTLEVLTIETASLGDRSYVLLDGTSAAVIDPQRDVDRIVSLLEERGAQLVVVLETHLHNDYVTGGLELATRYGATYVVPAGPDLSFACERASDGSVFTVGGAQVRAVHTPGHTPEHLSYVAVVDGREQCTFTGGSMLFGTVGRTDLLGDAMTDRLTRNQYRSVRRLADQLPGDAQVYPTHGFGSFCASSPSDEREDGTIDDERRSNLALRIDDEETFVARMRSAPGDRPRYYDRMAGVNAAGPAPIDLTPAPTASPEQIRARIAAGDPVVDLRPRDEFADAHTPGTLSIEDGDQFATYLGWLVPIDAPVTLLGADAEQIAHAQREMARIGFDRPAGAATGAPRQWVPGGEVRGYRTVRFADLAEARGSDEVVVVDVRRDDEWADGHVEGAIHIPLHALEERIGELPDRELWVHCASGFRASIAASVLDRAGHRVVVIDDEWSEAAKDATIPVLSTT